MNRDYGKTRNTVFSAKRFDRITSASFSQILHTAYSYCNDLWSNNIHLISSRLINFCTNKSTKGGTNEECNFVNPGLSKQEEKEEKACQQTERQRRLQQEQSFRQRPFPVQKFI